MPDRAQTIDDLVRGFAQHIRELKGPDYLEARVRSQYIDPFWRLLGWDVDNRAQLGPADAEVIMEPTVDVADGQRLRARRPDYIFRLNGFPRFVVEAKKPAVDLDADHDAIYQAKRYAWSSTIPFAVLTDFEQFRLFDTTLKPILTAPARGLIDDFRLDFHQYPAQWDVLTATFGREAVAGGSLERLRAKVRKVSPRRRIRSVDRMLIDLRGDEPVDREFLDCLQEHRKHFARALYRDNRNLFPEAHTLHGAAALTEAVQRLMDRLVFMRVCEDRDVAPWGELRATLDRIAGEGGGLYDALKAEFRRLDKSYNGYLFKAHPLLEAATVDDAVLADFIRDLYPPDGPWDFSAIGDDILGIVYERFLGNVVTVQRHQADVVEKPEVRHAGGVYYTPRFVVDTIIRRVVGPKVEGRAPADVLDVKILDPACGSGSFLVAALQYLFDHCIAAVQTDPSLAVAPLPGAGKRRKKSEIAFQDRRDGRWYLAPDFRSALLTHCIHGVDIDQQAVEVTVMSLYLKMLESKLPENWQQDWVENRLLPPLDNNIRCGNSLIDPQSYDDYLTFAKKGLFGEDADTAFRINRFDWNSRTGGFGRILDEKAVKERGRAGFDCIIGNPPYIRVQELNKWAPEECEFYKWRYASAKKGNYDIYVVFTERALSLLAPDGLLGFIMPHKFWQAAYGEGLRRIIAEGRHLRSVVDFAHQQVFRGATTYTAVHVLGQAPNKPKVDYARFDELADGVAQCSALDASESTDGVVRYNADMPTGANPWRFMPRAADYAFKAISSAATLTLGEAAERLFQGVRTSSNEVFVLRLDPGRKDTYISDALGRAVELESSLLKPFLGGDNIRRYFVEPASAVAIFPYTPPDTNGRVSLFPADEIRRECPRTWEYLKACEQRLRAREKAAMNHDRWYGYGRTQNLDLFGIPRILVPDMMDKAAFALDEAGDVAFVSGYGIILAPDHRGNEAYFTGLLNSSLLSGYLKSISTTLRGGWYRTFPQFMRQIPIKLPASKAEQRVADRITESVRAIMAAKARLHTGVSPPLSDRERTRLETEVEAHERRIDEAVYLLYGVEVPL
ncbi:MAG TPA: Eco57I restriction-modification methylase domain-containing protein [Phycisphaerales bacterium]|nr:Eco57I restriction-modification methylase domain-containing protein [Phycisphaerales bacterium]